MPTTGALSDYVETSLYNALFRNTAFPTPPTSVYVACFTVAPTDVAGSGTEVSGGAYARLAVSCGTSGSGAGSGWTVTAAAGTVTNAADLLWAVCTASWGTIVSIGIFDASSGGNLLARADLTTSVPITTVNIDQLKIVAGALVITLD